MKQLALCGGGGGGGGGQGSEGSGGDDADGGAKIGGGVWVWWS